MTLANSIQSFYFNPNITLEIKAKGLVPMGLKVMAYSNSTLEMELPAASV